MKSMQKLLLLFAMVIAFSLPSMAQVDPCANVWAYCGNDSTCIQMFAAQIGVNCGYNDGSDISSDGFLPPPGGGNPRPGITIPCAAPPQLPQPYLTGPYSSPYLMVPYLLAHTYWNTPPGCTDWTIEWYAQ